MTRDEALQAVAVDMHAALKAWQAADYAQLAADNWPDDDGKGYANAVDVLDIAVVKARTLTIAVNHRIAELRANSVTGVTLDIGGDE